jgi:hypothetical protein
VAQDNQRIQAEELTIELDREACNRMDYVLAYIVGELDLDSDRWVSSSC